MSKSLVAALSSSFSKPVEYTEAALKHFNVTLPLPKFRTPDDGLGDFYSAMTAHFSSEPSLTKQEFTAECDINTIMARFVSSGYDPTVLPMTSRKAIYGDFTAAPESYHAALNYVKGTERAFMELPADIRARFDNDPQKFLNFVDNPDNQQELIDMGLATDSRVINTPALSNGAVGGVGNTKAPDGVEPHEELKSSSVGKKTAKAAVPHDGGSGD